MPALSSASRFPPLPGLHRSASRFPRPASPVSTVITATGPGPVSPRGPGPDRGTGPAPAAVSGGSEADRDFAFPEPPAAGAGVVRVMLAEDHPLMREGVKACLSAAAGIAVVGEVADGQAVVPRAKELKPDVVLMDLNMPGLNGLEATEQLRRELPEVRVLVFTILHEPQYVAQLLRAGAHGYVTKDAPPDELMTALRRVARGGTYFSSEVAQGFLGAQLVGRERNGLRRLQTLSPRELEVLRLIADGHGNKQIAARLNLSTRTVETHRERIMRKLDLHSVAALTRFAIAQGLVGLE